MNIKTLNFLKQLGENNDKIWFDLNRKWYDESKKDFLADYEKIHAGVGEFDINVLNAKEESKKLFRINRDIRFSNDKSPYKSNMGGVIFSGKKGQNPSLYYIHIEPGKSGLAIGNYMPEKPQLDRIREHISKNFETFEKVVNDKQLVKSRGQLQTDQSLVRIPSGYSESDPAAKYLKLKSYTFWKDLSDNELIDKDFVSNAIKLFKSGKIFIDILNQA